MLKSPNCPFGKAKETGGLQGIADAKRSGKVDSGRRTSPL
jgi:hypothetical protein